MRHAGTDGDLLIRLEHLAGLAPDRREAELAAMELETPELAAKLRQMLSKATDAERWFRQLESSIGRGLAAELDSAWAPGRVVGPYRLERVLGTGGMGAVFLAHKADGELKRPVALKLVPPGLIDADSLKRFRQERDLLAALSHPHIAPLLDAGMAEDGQPWIAMEYIRGLDLLTWCREQASGIEQRVQVFRDLVAAVRFAHRNLVVHGDIKPANVRIDAHGRLRLLDFGIARLLGELERNPESPPEALAFTPAYAAPELHSGQPASVASDIYALGVLLQEILEIQDPPGDRRSRRELALIAGHAIRDDPHERYESARELDEELRRWLAFEPVMARNGGALYRFGKRLHRYPWASLGIAAALVALVNFGAYSRFQAQRFAEQRDSAEQLARFMEQVFLGVDPENARDRNLSARVLLDRGLASLGSDPPTTAPARDVRARFASIMGITYQRLGDYATARKLLEEALATGVLNHATQREVLLELADNHYLSGRFGQAEAAYREQLDRVESNAERARALAGLGRTLAQTGRPGEAIGLLDESIRLTREDTSVEPWRLAQRLNDSGSARMQRGEYGQAVALLEEALGLRRHLDASDPAGAGSPATATLLNNLGLMHYLSGSPERAELALREALSMRRTLLSPDHPDLAQTLTNLGLLVKDYGDSGEAVALLREALEVRQAALAPDHYRIAQAKSNLAIGLRETGRYDEAERLFRETLPQLVELQGPEHPAVAVAHTELAALLLATGRLDQAESEYRRSLEIRRRILPDGHPHLAWSLVGLGRVALARGETGQARNYLGEAVAIRRATLPEGNALRLEAEALLSEVNGDE